MSHSPIHNCPNCTCGMIELTWSDRTAFVFPDDAHGIADAIVSCVLDHSYDRTDTGIPYGLPDEIFAACAEIVDRHMSAGFPRWKDNTIPCSQESKNVIAPLRQELVAKLTSFHHMRATPKENNHGLP